MVIRTRSETRGVGPVSLRYPKSTISPSSVGVAILFILLFAGCHLSFGDLDPADEPRPAFADDATNFLVLGDWGRGGRFSQDEVARQMGETAEEIGAAFVITTGDNFYERGVESVSDSKWERSYEAVYDAPSLQIPWYVTLGNHDYLGDVSAQVAYTQESDRWMLPSHYHSVEIPVGDTTSALFVFLDTVPLVDGRSASTPEAEVTNEETEAAWDAEQQLAWLDSTLARTDAHWRFAVGHHPLYAAGVPGFAALSLEPDSLRLVFIGHNGTVGYSTTILPRQGAQELPTRTESLP